MIVRFIEAIIYPFQYVRRMIGRFFGGTPAAAKKFSIAGKIALSLFILLAILWGIFLFIALGKSWEFQDTLLRYVYLPIGMVIVTVFCYFGIKMLDRQSPVLYPEIDEPWREFEDWMEGEGFTYEDVPLYLVIGTPDQGLSDVMHHNTPDSLNGIPKSESSWLHWYGNENGVFLHVKKCSLFNESMLSKSDQFNLDEDDKATLEPPEFDDEPDGYGYDSMQSGDDSKTLDPHMDDVDSYSIDGEFDSGQQEDADEETYQNVQDHEFLDRMRYIGERLRDSVPGQISLYGIMLAVPYEPFLNSKNSSVFSDAIFEDFAALCDVLPYKIPVTIAFTGMEAAEGFGGIFELTGPKANRFGVGCKQGDVPVLNDANLDQLVARVRFNFESWAMKYFSTGTKLQNGFRHKSLYHFLTEVRHQFSFRLEGFLKSIFRSRDGKWNRQLLITGCYFCGTGKKPADRVFSAGLWKKLGDFQSIAGWTDSEFESDRIRNNWANVLFAFSLTLLGLSIYFAYAFLSAL